MSDYVKIRVTYPTSDSESNSAPGSTARSPAPASSEDGGVDRSRKVNVFAFAVVGVLVAVGGIGAGLLYTSVSGPSSPAPKTAEASPAPTEENAGASPAPTEENAVAAAPAEPEALRTAPARDADAGTDTSVAKAATESLARFETASSAPARDLETVSPRPAPPLALTTATPEEKVRETATPEQTTPESAALPPPVKRPETRGKTSKVMASAAPVGGSVARSQLTSDVRGREPVDRLSSRVKIGEGSGRKLFYFTELQGLNGETIFHRWEHDGRTVVSLRFNVGSDRWRAYSSKTIPAHQAGDWRVVVANAQGDVLASSQFVAE